MKLLPNYASAIFFSRKNLCLYSSCNVLLMYLKIICHFSENYFNPTLLYQKKIFINVTIILFCDPNPSK